MTAKPNRKMPESEGPLLCVEINTAVTMEDYSTVYIPAMREIFEVYGEVRALFYYPDHDNYFPWEEEAAALDFQLTAEHGQHAKKIALVNAPEKVVQRWMIKQPLLGGEVKVFNYAEMQKAIDWAKS